MFRAEIVNFDDPVAVTGLGLKLALAEKGNPERLSVTELLDPNVVTVTVTELLDLRFTVIEAGADMLKSPGAGFTVSDSEVVRVSVPSLPLMFSR